MEELKQRGTYFKLRVLDDEQAAICSYDGRQVINLAANNLPRALQSSQTARGGDCGDGEVWRKGRGRVRTMAGTMRIRMELEEKDCGVQECRSVRGISVRVCGECWDGGIDSWQGRLHTVR